MLLTYMRNSDIVRRFKKALVRAFFDMRAQRENQSDPMPQSVSHRADHIVSTGRVFNTLLKTGRDMGLSRADAVARANTASVEVGGVDLVKLMGAKDIVRPAEARRTEFERLSHRFAEWLASQDRTEHTNEALMRDGLGIDDPTRSDYMLLGRLMRHLGWYPFRRRMDGRLRRGYAKAVH